nr:MAG TPA: hypothetical protein [Bacteriophage sp.]
MSDLRSDTVFLLHFQHLKGTFEVKSFLIVFQNF